MTPADGAAATLGSVSADVQAKQRHILMVLAYSIVLADWHLESVRPERGHNVGAVLIDRETGLPVFWARNCNAIKNNGTQHAETQLMWHFLEESEHKYLDKYEIYTILEPC